MNKLFKVALVAAGMLMSVSFVSKAQSKTGFIYFSSVVEALPERAVVAKSLQDYQKTFADQFQLMQTEYQTKGSYYDKNKGTMSDAIRQAKEGELSDIQNRMQTFSTTAQQKMEAKQNELVKPLIDKVTMAASTVAKEKGYAFVLDATQQILIVKNDADDLTAAVKLKLGVK